ncbi:MAG: DUF1643 domain-containing protein [Clostridia bacterium]|nr:DUF1643 domain-containing protein [Clostridia bacterium]
MDSRENWLYEINADNSARYVLGEKGKRMLVCLGINPSSATPEKLDKTSISVRSIASNNRYDGWVIINLYPVRGTNISSLPDEMDPEEVKKNVAAIKRLICTDEVDIWAAFGDLFYSKSYFFNCFKELLDGLSNVKVHWKATRINRSGTPRHPSREKNSAVLVPFDMESFVNSFS